MARTSFGHRLAAGEIFINQNWGAITVTIDALAGFACRLAATMNPLQTFLPVPQIGQVYGHSTAYLAGIAAPMLLTAGERRRALIAYRYDTRSQFLGAGPDLHGVGDVLRITGCRGLAGRRGCNRRTCRCRCRSVRGRWASR